MRVFEEYIGLYPLQHSVKWISFDIDFIHGYRVSISKPRHAEIDVIKCCVLRSLTLSIRDS